MMLKFAPIDDFPPANDGADDARATNDRSLISRRASEVTPERIEWVWPGRIARGKLILFAGDPGTGKSTLLYWIASTTSRGGHWPCGEGGSPRGSVIILSAEDGEGDTIVPRLMASEADRQRIHLVSAVRVPGGLGRQSFSLQSDIGLLERLIDELGDVVAVIIDPVSSYMGKIDSHKKSEVRGTLEPLGEMASRKRVAVICNTHVSKGGNSTKAMHKFIGSIGFVAIARAAFIVAEDPDDPSRRLLLEAKNNLARKQPGLAFMLEQREVAEGIIGSSVIWDTEHVAKTADDVLGGNGGGDRSAKDEAVEFLERMLEAGPVEVSEIERQARAAGLLGEGQRINQCKPLRSAKSELKIETHRVGFGPGATYRWTPPTDPSAP